MSNRLKTNTFFRYLCIGGAIVIVCAGAFVLMKHAHVNINLPHVLPQTVSAGTTNKIGPFKVLHVMSYHLPWEWTETQLNGFKDALRGMNVEYRVIQMDAKRLSSEQWKQQIGAEARNAIDTWKPDLVFTGDDDAQKYVARYYVNSRMPIVFCAVNANPSLYGFTGSSNVAGVCEPIHFVQTVELLRQIAPDVRRIAIITDTGSMWGPIIEMMKMNEDKLPADMRITGYYVCNTFEEYKAQVTECHRTADALGMLGVFEFKDSDGANTPLETVQEWTVRNSSLPDFSFWKDRIDKGTLCAVTVSGYAQGYEAGKIARGILSEGRRPDTYAFTTTDKGISVVNLARARKLDLSTDPGILMSVDVVKTMPWE